MRESASRLRSGLPPGETIPDRNPIAVNVFISGSMYEGQEITGNYDYSDDFTTEGTSTFKWYTADDAIGTNKAQIPGETSQTYIIVAGDVGKFISFEVTPVDSDTNSGAIVESTAVEVQAPSWVSIFDNTKWEPRPLSLLTWDGSKWTSSGNYGHNELQPIGTWTQGFRPTKSRVTYSASNQYVDSFTMIAGGGSLYQGPYPPSNVAFDLYMEEFLSDITIYGFTTDGGGSGFEYFEITNIEFYG